MDLQEINEFINNLMRLRIVLALLIFSCTIKTPRKYNDDNT